MRKDMKIYNRGVYEHLIAQPIPGIPRIYDLCEEDGVLTVIEQYISGDTLEEQLSQGRQFSINEIIHIGMAVCDILSALHHCAPPIIHRDIKPSNIIEAEGGRIFLLDLNAAKFMDTQKEKDTRLLGTSGFAAPEQYGFGVSNTRTDVYGLGALLRELLSSMPSALPSAPDKLTPVSAAPIEAVSANENDTFALADPDLYKLPAMNKIIERCTLLDPADRYPTVDAVCQELGVLSRQTRPKRKISLPRTKLGIREFLPPGFRSGTPINMVTATLIYGAVIWAVSLMSQEDLGPLLTILLQVTLLSLFFAIVLFSCNYLNIHSKVPLCNSPNRLVRILGILLWDFTIFVAINILAGVVIFVLILHQYG